MSDEINDIDSQEILKATVELLEEKVNNANALRFMVNTEGWEILLNTFENMKHEQLDVLSEQRPGDDKAILAAHSVWFSVVHTLDNITNAVKSAIEDGNAARFQLDELRRIPQKEDEDWL